MRRLAIIALLLAACGGHVSTTAPPLPASGEDFDRAPLLELTSFIAHGDRRIFSLLISKNGHVVYELYTSSLSRDHAHYLMSVTKSVTSSLVGIAMGDGIVGDENTSVADALPPAVFPSPADRERFRPVTIREVLGMSALDANVPPHRSLPEDVQRGKDFFAAPNRATFALGQKLLPEPGVSFQYTDITPQIASGIVTYATKKTLFDYANEKLFGPLGFSHQEWMHEDETGIDNGAYGLRLRPVDMQKFGILYLQHGRWEGKQIVPEAWVKTSFTPWTGPKAYSKKPAYGSYWWQFDFGAGWLMHAAVGWRGQRIGVVPDQGVVVTMTGNIAEDEHELFDTIVSHYVKPAMSGHGNPAENPRLDAALAEANEKVRTGPPRQWDTDRRMLPSVAPLETHHGF